MLTSERLKEISESNPRTDEIREMASELIAVREAVETLTAERDDLIVLLKFAVSSDLLWIIRRQLAGKGNWSEETKQKGRRILEIVEEK